MKVILLLRQPDFFLRNGKDMGRLILITGASGSGKSAFAENRVTQYEGIRRVYLATMDCSDTESQKRIQKHRMLRRGKGFTTIEKPGGLGELPSEVWKDAAVLLEDLSNLLSNEMFSRSTEYNEYNIEGLFFFKKISEDLQKIRKVCLHLVIVTNEVFEDGIRWKKEMLEYVRTLGMLNQKLAEQADEVYRVHYGIPVRLK